MTRALRRFVLATSVPPIDGLYRFLYRAVARVAAYVLCRRGNVLSLYVCRGFAKQERRDIDAGDEEQHERCRQQQIQRLAHVAREICLPWAQRRPVLAPVLLGVVDPLELLRCHTRADARLDPRDHAIAVIAALGCDASVLSDRDPERARGRSMIE